MSLRPSPAQVTYVGRPIFHPPLVDPVPTNLRAFTLDGDPTPVELDLREYEEPLVKAERKISAAFRANPRLRGDWRNAAELLVGGLGGFYEPLIRCLGLAAQQTTEIDDADVCAFVHDLLERKEAGAERVAAYGDNLVLRTLRTFRAKDATAPNMKPKG